MKFVEIYTDGACRPNPGKGAWAYCIVDGKKPIDIQSGIVEEATNNQMEMRAVIEALRRAEKTHPNVHIYLYTDSMYIQKGITVWAKKWKKNGWNVKNSEDWQELDKINGRNSIHWSWIRGHNKTKWNEFVDKLCSETLTNVKKEQ